jgi:histidine triad (HIT) family protein
MSECIFCKIVEGEASAQKLYEDETSLCILDIAQVVSEAGNFVPGRCLVIPKRHVTWFYDLEDQEAGQLFVAAKVMAKKIKKAFNPDFVTVFIRGQRVPHAHIILQPSSAGDPLDKLFASLIPSFKLAPEELLNDMARKILES